MNFVRLLPVFISILLLSAHFMRAGQMAVTYVLLFVVLLLLIRKTWVPWVMQVTLLLGAVEWLRTLASFAQLRMEYGMPWMRMAIILVAVALFTAFSSLVFRHKALQKRYSDEQTTKQED